MLAPDLGQSNRECIESTTEFDAFVTTSSVNRNGMAVRRRQSTKDARALAFSATVFVSLFLIIAVRSRWRQLVAHRPPSPALWWIGGGASFMLALVFFVPLLRDLFKFGL